MNTNILFVRHGETELNKHNKLHKYKDDSELNKNGIKQIRKTAKIIKTYNPDIIFSSQEKRADQSAAIIAKICKISFVSIDGLQERNWGEFSGMPWKIIQNNLDIMTLEERYNYIPPKGESWKEFEARLSVIINDIVSHHQGQVLVIITHGGVIRALIPILLNIPKEESFKYNPENASLTIIKYNGKKFTKVTEGDTSTIIT